MFSETQRIQNTLDKVSNFKQTVELHYDVPPNKRDLEISTDYQLQVLRQGAAAEDESEEVLDIKELIEDSPMFRQKIKLVENVSVN